MQDRDAQHVGQHAESALQTAPKTHSAHTTQQRRTVCATQALDQASHVRWQGPRMPKSPHPLHSTAGAQGQSLRSWCRSRSRSRRDGLDCVLLFELCVHPPRGRGLSFFTAVTPCVQTRQMVRQSLQATDSVQVAHTINDATLLRLTAMFSDPVLLEKLPRNGAFRRSISQLGQTTDGVQHTGTQRLRSSEKTSRAQDRAMQNKGTVQASRANTYGVRGRASSSCTIWGPWVQACGVQFVSKLTDGDPEGGKRAHGKHASTRNTWHTPSCMANGWMRTAPHVCPRTPWRTARALGADVCCSLLC